MSASKKSSRRWARASGACLRSLLVACVLAGACTAHAANEIYRWKDEAGQWHYSDQPPANAKADVVPIAPPPKDPAAAPPDPVQDPALAMPDAATAPAVPIATRTVRDVQRGCSTIVNACAVPGGPDRASCLASVRQCAADPTMEKQDCCPAACSMRYAELRAQGLPDGLAFTRAVYGVPGCVPGADEAIQQPVGSPQ
ncbi:MAG TPA: DUF4124 domain-containing protein [Xanthomonadales bacterium]|nr:DUF4124 domain-containing protein [Xanthomonadales bacterium]